MALFNDWSVYGDSMLLPEYLAVAMYDEDSTEPIQQFAQKFPITKKMGEDKGSMANPDIDQQFATKMYGIQLKMNSQQKGVFDPTCFINITTKVLTMGGDSGMMADWNLVGKVEQLMEMEVDQQSQNPAMKSFMDSLPDDRLFMKKLQYRYNHDTKLSQVRGFLTSAKNYTNDLNMQGWRTVPLTG